MKLHGTATWGGMKKAIYGDLIAKGTVTSDLRTEQKQ